jgi:hypothetical protein
MVETFRCHKKLQFTQALMKKHHKELNELKNQMQTLLFAKDNNSESSLLGQKNCIIDNLSQH